MPCEQLTAHFRLIQMAQLEWETGQHSNHVRFMSTSFVPIQNMKLAGDASIPKIP